ncbi:MAG: DUF2804 domain-containing protein [Spirochaetia bacterium]|nr:DUF2804 domain-containing protein [Spirochaetia bacterium]
MTLEGQRLLNKGDLLDGDGRLAQAGYATTLCRRYDRAAIRAGGMRIKEWDYYCVMDGDTVLALTIADNGYMGMDSVTLLDLRTKKQQTKSFIRLFPQGKTNLPATSETGDVMVERPGYRLRFENDHGVRTLFAHVDQFLDGQPLNATVVLDQPPQDSMVIATPFAGKPRHFYYNQKINCLRASGQVALGDEVRTFLPGVASAVLDWGGGVWTYSNTWYWSSLNSFIDGTPFGFNLGYGFSDRTPASENALFYNGVIHKLDEVTFHIPEDNYLLPWKISSSDNRLNLDFEPVVDRSSTTNFLLIKSMQHQVFGYFSGVAVLDDKTELTLTRFPGFAEDVYNRW